MGKKKLKQKPMKLKIRKQEKINATGIMKIMEAGSQNS